MCCSVTVVRPSIVACRGWRVTGVLIWRRTRSIANSGFDSRSRLDRLPRPAVDEPGGGRWLLVDWRQHDVHRGPPNGAHARRASAPLFLPLALVRHVPLFARLSWPLRAFRSLSDAVRPLWLVVQAPRVKPRDFLPSAEHARWRANAWRRVFVWLARRGRERRPARRFFASVRWSGPSSAAADRRPRCAPSIVL